MNIYVPSHLLIIVGLACNIVGAILVSLEAFGIKEFTEKLEDERTYGLRVTSISYVAMINQFSVFILVNGFWVIALIVFANFPISFALLLFPFGFFLWKFIVKVFELSSKTIYKLAPIYRKREGCLKLTIIVLPLFLWAVTYGAVELIHIVVRFGIDLPLRVIAERLLGKWLLSLFGYIKNKLDKEHRTRLKVPSLLGAALLILGFVYQLVGIVLIMVGQL